MLDKVDFPLTNTQISNFFLEQDYTDYFRVQQVISDLVDADLIRTESTHSNTQYTITAAGKETLEFFKDKISDAIEHDTMAFLEKNKHYYWPVSRPVSGRAAAGKIHGYFMDILFFKPVRLCYNMG